jgi:hypothetical protein
VLKNRLERENLTNSYHCQRAERKNAKILLER